MPKEKTMTFEEALKSLEKTVAQLEDAGLDLDTSLRLFEEGIRLSRICTASLESARQRVDTLMAEDADDAEDKDQAVSCP